MQMGGGEDLFLDQAAIATPFDALGEKTSSLGGNAEIRADSLLVESFIRIGSLSIIITKIT